MTNQRKPRAVFEEILAWTRRKNSQPSFDISIFREFLMAIETALKNEYDENHKKWDGLKNERYQKYKKSISDDKDNDSSEITHSLKLARCQID